VAYRSLVRFLTLAAALSGCAGCSKTLQTPTMPDASPSTLLVTSLTVAGFYADGRFSYVPKVVVQAASGPLEVVGVTFTRPGSGGSTPLRTLHLGPIHLGAGGTYQLSSVEIVTDLPLDGLSVSVAYVSQTGLQRTAVADAEVPVVPTEESADAKLEVRAFSVPAKLMNGRYHYFPKLTLKETSGRTSVRIVRIAFELLDVGPDGRVQPSQQQIPVPAGGTIVLDENEWGPWVEIDSSAEASRVAVAISFVDDRGRSGSVSAVAPVSW
jgi:hypothetical protein